MLIGQAQGNPDGFLPLLLLFTGLRRGEAMGLRWEEEDIRDGYIHVERAAYFDENTTMEDDNRTQVYYAHPYSSFERGTNENWNVIVRRFLPNFTTVILKEVVLTGLRIRIYDESQTTSTPCRERDLGIRRL